MDITSTLDALAEVIAAAKPRALGGGAIIDRDHAQQLIEHARSILPEEVRQAQGVLAERDIVIENAHSEAETIRAEGRADAAQMISADEITRGAQAEGQRILHEAYQEAERKRAEVDAYVDAKLAAFEGTLQRTLESVAHGRQKLAGTAGAPAEDAAPGGYITDITEAPVA